MPSLCERSLLYEDAEPTRKYRNTSKSRYHWKRGFLSIPPHCKYTSKPARCWAELAWVIPLLSDSFWVIQLPRGLTLTGSVKKPGYVKPTKTPQLAKTQIKKKNSHSNQVILQLHAGRVFVWVQVQTWLSPRLSPGLPHRSGRTSPGPRSPQPPTPERPNGQQGLLKHTGKRGKRPQE